MSRIFGFGLLILLGLNLFLYGYLFQFFQEPELGIHFLKVGQGDAELVRLHRSTVLIDAGPGTRVIEEIDKVLPVYDRTIDIAIVSHPSLDHIAGMMPVLERYQVRLFVMTGVETTLAEYQKLKEIIKNSNIPVLYAIRGEKINFRTSEIAILFPAKLLRGREVPKKDMNDTSIVARLSHPGLSALFTGDITSKAEKTLFAEKTDILKVPHHGSKYSSSKEFLERVSPKWAAIGVGRNSYGHPTSETLSRLSAVGAKIFRTDIDGTVSFFVDNGVVKIKTME